jgi:hypothetical protein
MAGTGRGERKECGGGRVKENFFLEWARKNENVNEERSRPSEPGAIATTLIGIE